MSKLDILVAPDPRLKVTSQPVPEVNDSIRRLMDDMLETMYAAPGIGLAAPQVGKPVRVIVVDVAEKDEEPHPYRMVNPQIVDASEELRVTNEGCLSVPDFYADVERADLITVEYQDETGAKQTVKADGILATCIAHEIEHLDGVLFVDHLSLVKRNIILRKLQKAKRAGTL
ncbi:MAG TPA: peptide deformylase [Alphaproteobacteria bacterium]|jgi:peptide deformylase|nr:peptide deformylase [Alphaproteobacteria bacterium]